MDDKYFEKLKEQVLNQRGLDFSQYSRSYVERRINARLLSLKISDIVKYIEVLKNTPEEYQLLLDAFSINTTEFFRDISMWNSFEQKYLPEIIDKKIKSFFPTLRIWSCACSSGEEAYTVAIILKEFIINNNLKKKIQLYLFATDIDTDAINKAKTGIYFNQSMKNIPEKIKKKYFTIIEDNKNPKHALSHLSEKYRISDEIIKMIDFKHHNFIMDLLPAGMDIIFCRNVIIYLTPDMKFKLIEKFYNSLVKSGTLIIGKAELLLSARELVLFKYLDQKEHMYIKNIS